MACNKGTPTPVVWVHELVGCFLTHAASGRGPHRGRAATSPTGGGENVGERTRPEERHVPVTHTAHVHPAVSVDGQGALELSGLAKEDYLGICRCSLTSSGA